MFVVSTLIHPIINMLEFVHRDNIILKTISIQIECYEWMGREIQIE